MRTLTSQLEMHSRVLAKAPCSQRNWRWWSTSQGWEAPRPALRPRLAPAKDSHQRSRPPLVVLSITDEKLSKDGLDAALAEIVKGDGFALKLSVWVGKKI